MANKNRTLTILAIVAGMSLYSIFAAHNHLTSLLATLRLTTTTQDIVGAIGSASAKVSPAVCSGRLPFQNSDAWLTGNRLGNAVNTELFGHDTLLKLLLGSSSNQNLFYDSIGSSSVASSTILSQTLSHSNSSFLNLTNGKVNDDLYRLMFLAIHHHQHSPAQEEAIDRLLCNSSPSTSSSPIGKFDFECPDAKFIVTHVPSYGLGMSLRQTAADALLLGIATNRVALLINSLNTSNPAVSNEMKAEWPLASCERRDMQCVFMPVSPCVITMQDLENAAHLNHGEVMNLRNTGELNENFENAKVIVVPQNDVPKPKPVGLLTRIEEYVRDELTMSLPWDMSPEHLENILDTLVVDGNSNVRMLKDAAAMYLLRLNWEYRAKLHSNIENAFPSDFNADASIGLPVRSSDKCIYESECLSFENYTTVAYNIAMRDTQRCLQSSNCTAPLPTAHGLVYDTIVLTSESSMILESRKLYEGPNASFPFRFVVNNADVLQGTGNPSSYSAMGKLNVTADDIMLSTVSSIAFQMMSKVVVGNRCSNFHRLMSGFVTRGCGAAHDSTFEYLQDSEISEFRVCCDWSWSKECRTRLQSGKFGAHFKIGQDVGNPNLNM